MTIRWLGFLLIVPVAFFLGAIWRDVDLQRGARPWNFIINRIIQSENDAHYLDQCLLREDYLIEKLGYEPDWRHL